MFNPPQSCHDDKPDLLNLKYFYLPGYKHIYSCCEVGVLTWEVAAFWDQPLVAEGGTARFATSCLASCWSLPPMGQNM